MGDGGWSYIMKKTQKYKFSWNLLGDIADGRPNLGNKARLEIYRLMQFTFRDVIEQHVGTKETDEIFYEAGKLAGKEFYANMLTPTTDINEFLRKLERTLEELGIGILRVEKTDIENQEFVRCFF